jgi:hypothetical protein
MPVSRRAIAHIGLLAGLALLASACNGDDPDQASDDTTTTEADPATTTTAPQPTTTTFPIEGPEPWTDIVRDVFERQSRLDSEPDPSAVEGVVSQDCDCYEFFLQTARTLATNGEHIEGAGAQPTAVMLTGQGGNGFQRVIVKVTVGARQRVDSNGTVLQEFPPQEPSCISLLLAPSGPGDTYRIHDLLLPDRCPAELA